MQITMMGEYAVRAMMYMAGKPHGEVVQISDISKAWDIPENFLRKIVPQLARAGLIISQRGTGGGISLLRSPEEITALNIIEAAEGQIFLNKCLISDSICDRSSWCAMHSLWEEAQEKLKEVLQQRSLAQLVSISQENREKIQTIS